MEPILRYSTKGFLIGTLLTAILVVPSTASAQSTTGTWVAYPGQSTAYQTQVKQPINDVPSASDQNVSVFANKNKNVIPVKFGLLSGLGPFVFESIYSDNPGNTANDFSFLSFTPDSTLNLTFNDLYNLVANYTFTIGNCHGGSLRWSVRVNVGNDDNTTNDGSVFIYYGGFPNFTDCTTSGPATNQSGSNMIGMSDLRYDTSQVGGTFYDSYSHAQTLVGGDRVIRASLVLDSGWAGDQRLTLGSATVNDNTFTPSPPTALAPTCDLPPAKIMVTRDSVDSPSLVTTIESIQPADNNEWFRIIDCKYMYNLATSSLPLGSGCYKVEAVIDGEAADGAAYFCLK
jgi:hypothetical protein